MKDFKAFAEKQVGKVGGRNIEVKEPGEGIFVIVATVPTGRYSRVLDKPNRRAALMGFCQQLARCDF